MSVIIRLQNLPLTASSIDIRTFFRGLSIPDGGVHIVGGQEGDAFIAFSTDEDARQAMQLTGHKLKDSTVRLLLSSRNEMFKVIEQARIDAGQPSSPSPVPAVPAASLTVGPPTSGLPHAQSSSPFSNNIQESNNSSRTGGLGVAYPNPNAASNFMGTHSGLGGLNFGGMPSENSYLPQNSHGIGVEGLGGTTITSFPRSLSSTSIAPSLLGTQQAPPISGNANSSNQNIFGMTAAMAGMPMPFPSIIPNGAGNSLPMNLNMSNMPNLNMNPAAMIGLGGMIPPGMHPPTAPPNLQGPHRMLMSNTSNGSSNMGISHLPSQISFSHPPPGLLGNHPRPQAGVGSSSSGGGGYPAGLNPMFMSGGVGGMSNGNGRMPGPHGPNIRGIGLDPNIKDRQNGPVGNGSFRLGSQVRGFNDGPPRDNRDRRSRSNSRERRDISRRRNSKSRDRDRPDRRRKFSRSKSRSRSPKRISSRRESRDKEEHRRRSPEKGRGRRDSDPAPTPFNTTEEEHPAVKLIGIPKDASYREIRDFLRVDIMGGGDGIVRLYEEEVAFVKLEKAVDFPRAYRSNSRKLRGSVVNMEGISIERWVNEYKLNKIRTERDIDRDRERERNKDRDERGSDRDRDSRDRGERGSRPSRFNSASQSSCIVIRNLPPTITSRDVSSRLLKDAPVTELIVSAGPVSNGRHTAIAFIKLESSQLAQKMIDLIVRSQEGANLVVEVCNEDDFSNAKTRTSGGMNRMEQVMLRDRELKYGDTKSIFDLEPGLDDDSCSVMIERAPPNVNERDVFDFFSDIGLAPVNVKIMYDAQDACNGQIVCEFPDPHKARRATTKDGMLFGRGHVKVEMMPSGRRRNPVDPSLLSKGQMGQIRPSLLGVRPVAPGMLPSRFGVPPGPNPFVQALQNVNGPRHSTPTTPRGRGGPSRFGPRNEFATSSSGGDRDDRMGGSRVRGGTGISQQVELEPPAIDGPDMFGKPGCVLALENVPFKASMDDILHHLSSILNIDIAREKIIRRFDDSEKPTGDARVAFDTPAEAKLAHDRLTGTKMWNRLISYTIL